MRTTLFILLLSVHFSARAENYSCDNFLKNKGQKTNPWGKASVTGSPGHPEVIGFYSRGCFEGGTALELSGPGHEVACPQRNRFWGHPDTIESVKKWGQWSKDNGHGKLIIRDISQPRGGPVTGHGSHQAGRDVDITFETWKKDRPMTDKERQNFKVTKMATNDSNPYKKTAVSQFYSQHWKKDFGKIIAKITSSPKTARIFISPPIKKALCRQFARAKNGKALTAKQRTKLSTYIDSKEKQENLFSFPSWLRRIQPMGGHDGHFHVRLKCPKDSKDCKDQIAMEHAQYNDKTDPSGVGCSGTKLNWWTETDPKKPGRLKSRIAKLEQAKARAKKEKEEKEKLAEKGEKPEGPPPKKLTWSERKEAKKNFPQRCRDLIKTSLDIQEGDLVIGETDH